LPFTPNHRQNMISWLAARNDVPNYGQLVLYQLPKDTVVFGPSQIGNRIQENGTISAQFTLWNQSGSQVQQGNLLVVPVGGTFLYFEPVYLRANSSSSLPEFKKVILADSQNVVWDDKLEGALAQPSVPSTRGTRRTGKIGSLLSRPATRRIRSRSCWPSRPLSTGTTIRPGSASWSIRAGGTSGAAAETTMASKGAASGQPRL